jgi:DNA sulfur modification protein DndD
MLIKRLKVENYKTYSNLDIDLDVKEDRPIILIGGENGGGKTTFFEAINGALYGLTINSEQKFKELVNAGVANYQSSKISLEIHFSGKVLHEEQQYLLSRTYMLNSEGKPVESVRLNMSGSIFQYGTATPIALRQEQEAQVSKIIKANLPKELSRYFLFDAMEAGNLLKEDQLNRVIRENIENVMGFNKYLQLAKTAQTLVENHTAQRLVVEQEKKEYVALLEQKKGFEARLSTAQKNQEDALTYSIHNRELYESLKGGLNQETQIKSLILKAEAEIEAIHKKETQYRSDLESFTKGMESYIFMPKLAEGLRNEVSLILKNKNEAESQQKGFLTKEQIEEVAKKITNYLLSNNLANKDLTNQEIANYLIQNNGIAQNEDAYSFLEISEVKVLESLVQGVYMNPFPTLTQQQIELNIAIAHIPMHLNQIESYKAQISGKDYNLLKTYEDNQQTIKRLSTEIHETEKEIEKIAKRIAQFDIQASEEPDPKYEALKKLKPFFEDVANKLLKTKKQQLEVTMKKDLNLNLIVYRDVIDRVELSEDLKDLSFKIFHIAGNEIYLNQLNTASKQVVIQVLLKALHEYGDYDPPVMIDTVMGVLGKASRSTILENYFPQLSHQTILLSSDSEITKEEDLDKIESFIAKTYTLKRDKENQCTEVVEGYFN